LSPHVNLPAQSKEFVTGVPRHLKELANHVQQRNPFQVPDKATKLVQRSLLYTMAASFDFEYASQLPLRPTRVFDFMTPGASPFTKNEYQGMSPVGYVGENPREGQVSGVKEEV
jgi:hypothetical protein